MGRKSKGERRVVTARVVPELYELVAEDAAHAEVSITDVVAAALAARYARPELAPKVPAGEPNMNQQLPMSATG